jgi:type I restriction enzyme, S subunit
VIESFEIPDSWLQMNLGEIINYGKTEKAEPTEISSDAWVLELEDIEKDSSKLLQRLTFAQRQSKSTKNRFRAGDVLYGKLRPYLNKILIADCDGYCSTEILPLRANQAINGRFLFYWLKHPTFLNYVETVSHGLNMPRLGTESGKQAPLVLAPLNEQKRIADKLDRLLAKVDACRERCDRISLILKRFRQSVLAAATSGELTEDWRRNINRSLDSWQTKSGEEVFSFITSGSRGWATYYSNDGAIFLRVGNLNHDTIELDLKEIQHVNPPSGAEGKRTRIETGDILISITADIGMVAFIRESLGEAYINQHLCLARQTGEYHGAYLAHYLISPLGGLSQLTEMQRGVTKAGLTLGDIRSVQLIIPELDEQIEIVHRIEKLFAYADRLESRYQTARSKCDRLTPALLEKAFQGELVPQDPNDEPASVLLERIKSLRTNAEAKQTKPQRRKTASEKSYRSEVKMLTRKEIQPSHLSDILKASGSLTAEALWTASQLEIDDFYDQLKDEEAQNLLKETRADNSDAIRLLEAA